MNSQFRRAVILGGLLLSLNQFWAPHTAEAACLAQKPAGASGSGRFALLLAPRAEVSGYVAKGFVPVACPADISQLKAYVQSICSPSAAGSTASVKLLSLTGKTREEACRSALAALQEEGK